MTVYSFKCPATETLHGTAYFEVEAESEEAARALLAEDSSQYFTNFSETDGGTEWEAKEPEDFEEI